LWSKAARPCSISYPSTTIDGPIEAPALTARPPAPPRLSVDDDRRPH